MSEEAIKIKERGFELANDVSALVTNHEVATGCLQAIQETLSKYDSKEDYAPADASEALSRIRTAVSLWKGFSKEGGHGS